MRRPARDRATRCTHCGISLGAEGWRDGRTECGDVTNVGCAIRTEQRMEREGYVRSQQRAKNLEELGHITSVERTRIEKVNIAGFFIPRHFARALDEHEQVPALREIPMREYLKAAFPEMFWRGKA